MASLSTILGVDQNACNTCLTIHVIIGLLQNDVISVADILMNHRNLVFGYLNSSVMRDAPIVIPDLLFQMSLADKVCIIVIRKTPDGTFLIQDQKYGNSLRKRIYIVHGGVHFFLACPLFPTPKIPKFGYGSFTLPSRPDVPRPGSYESIDFGDPPEDFSDV